MEGIGLICWHILNDQGTLWKIEVEGYYLPALQTHLLRPQAYFSLKGGQMLIDGEKCTFHWKTGETQAIHDDCQSLLPIARKFNSSEQVKVIGPSISVLLMRQIKT